MPKTKTLPAILPLNQAEQAALVEVLNLYETATALGAADFQDALAHIARVLSLLTPAETRSVATRFDLFGFDYMSQEKAGAAILRKIQDRRGSFLRSQMV